MRNNRIHIFGTGFKEPSPPLIAAGLLLLGGSACYRGMPTITAVAIIALGATIATIERFRRSPALVPILLLHTTSYAAVYAVFIGAALHSAATQAPSSLLFSGTLDLALSVLIIAAALRRIVAAFHEHVEV